MQFHQCKKWNWVQNGEIECKTVKFKMIDSSYKKELDKQNGGKKLDEDWNSVNKILYKDFITKQNTKLSKNY